MKVVFAVLLLMLSGCSQQMQEFARSAIRRTPSSTTLPKATEFSGMKFSGGSNTLRAGDLGMTVTVSPTQSAMKGSSFGMRVGISRGPTSVH